jgi:PHD/YefM family antitoxin component YafN of YafNO toxin-antitoxin module
LAREVASCLEALRKSDVEKIVVTQNGKPVAVLLNIETFEAFARLADQAPVVQHLRD